MILIIKLNCCCCFFTETPLLALSAGVEVTHQRNGSLVYKKPTKITNRFTDIHTRMLPGISTTSLVVSSSVLPANVLFSFSPLVFTVAFKSFCFPLPLPPPPHTHTLIGCCEATGQTGCAHTRALVSLHGFKNVIRFLLYFIQN